MSRSRALTTIVTLLLIAGACSKDPEVTKREAMRSGDEYVAQKKYREAIIEYRTAIQADPRYAEARLKLANLYMQVEEPQNAYPEYVRAADLMPENLEAQLKTGHLLLLANQFDEAGSRADKALAADPNSVEAYLLKANVLAARRDFDGALAQLGLAIKVDPDRGPSYAVLAAVQQSKGDRAAAEEAFRRSIELDPKNIETRLALAAFYWDRKQRREAYKVLEAALTQDPKHVVANRTLAAFYVGSGRMADAERPLKMIAEITPGPEGRLGLAEYYVGAGRRADAKALLERLSLEPDGFAPARLQLAAMAYKAGDRKEAYRLLDEVLAKDAKQVEALAGKADLQLDDKRFDDALATVESALAVSPSLPRLHFLKGRALAARREIDEATASYQEAVKLEPRMLLAHIELARVSLAAGKTDQAIQYAQSALQVEPRSADARLLLGRAQILKGDASAAEQTLAPLKAGFADFPALQTEMGRLYALKNDFPRARAAFERAVAKDPSRVEAIEGLAALDLRAKRPNDARARIEAAVDRAPENAAVRVLAGRYYMAVNDAAAAERSLRHALTIAPNNLAVYRLLGQLYASQNRLADATKEFETIAEKQPNSVSAHTTLGVLLQMQERNDEARQRYQRAVEIDPRAAVAANNLAWLYAEEGTQLDMALQLAQSAKSHLPDMAEVSDTLGWVYYKKDMAVLAVRPLREAIEKDPKNALYHLHLGLAYAKTGDAVRARESIERALALNPKVAGAEEARAVLAAQRTDR